ncbi:hypothetical protein [Paenibacillus sp. 1781tsa1]|uniref:hypothetical protein n=1 Tax=Paenibacillus sp. 1781tsa1 TaxID=2953810 RepID=UPI00209E83D9|nr:hypothetical protein [Paenibacillus sp. 1781tsa1]MCP1185034.1 hypothetical protein [Paenibacillus sp. 1781tsa1]
MKTTHVGEVRKLVGRYLRDFNEKHGFEVGSSEEKLKKGYQMEADARSKKIVFDPREITSIFNDPEFASQAGVSTIENFIKILIAHEVGHILDYNKNSFYFYNEGYSEVLEKNAWRIGEQYVEQDLKNEYDAFKDFSMDSYRRDNKFDKM